MIIVGTEKAEIHMRETAVYRDQDHSNISWNFFIVAVRIDRSIQVLTSVDSVEDYL